MEFFGPFFCKVLVGVTSIGKVFIGDLISESVMNRVGSKGSYYIVSDERGGHVMVFIQFGYDFFSFGGCMVQIGLPYLVFRLVIKVTGFMFFKKGVVVYMVKFVGTIGQKQGFAPREVMPSWTL
jgi:hypothetical protein